MEPIAFTVVGGYLGSGKTTLVNHLLATTRRRLGVVVNDFGSLAVDAHLLAAAAEPSGGVLELANGCVCCSLADGMVGVLDELTARRPRLDQIVVEASGVADPGRLAQWGHSPGLRLDAVIVLAAADTVASHLADPLLADTLHGQLASADLVGLTKVDLVDAAERRRAERLVAECAPGRPLVDVLDGRLPLDAAPLPAGPLPAGVAPPETGGGGAAHATAHATVTVEWPGAIDRARLESTLAGLPDEVVRVKGWAHLDDGEVVVVQKVGRRLRLHPAAPDAPASSSLVVIAVGRVVEPEARRALHGLVPAGGGAP